MSFGRFLKNFFLHPFEVGAIAPTGKAYSKLVCAQVDWSAVKNIVELGAGDGAVTKYIIDHLQQDQKLLVFELNPDLFEVMKQRIKEQKNVVLINDTAEKLEEYMGKHQIDSLDVVFSEVPLVSLPKEIGQRIVDAVKASLKPGGLFLQIQYSLFSLKKLKNIFDDVKVKFTLWNLPPAFLYICKSK
ncbi:MAG: hypothetical protein A2V81_05400 [Candidatus Abawacabacteria bacterium RBG_16_42_10]|uniref:Methyltransferase domain-containing protein n=1 Tax=Candidatus Abawacabacteria bacterium RBG_16_42_10 TaxID=1817814 RepID=A0A1F4XJ64_9BACT|nr:MAG: hypothetical protein A2V81_05400 [Candidatus Abawacabacteria bacterium RBG_16_42_10]